MKPKISTLPLKRVAWNGCREMDPDARLHNLLLADLSSSKKFEEWLSRLTNDLYDDWFAAIGWPEGAAYCKSSVYRRETGFPGLQKQEGEM